MFSNIFACALESTDRLAFSGALYRYGTGIVTIPATNDYVSICFHTPPGIRTLYRASQSDKSGNEVEVTLIEDCAYSGGTACSGWNLNRHYKNVIQNLTNVRRGLSTGTDALTVSGGYMAPPKMMPGAAVGAQSPGAEDNLSRYIILEEDMNYALRLRSLDGAVKICTLVEIGTTPERNGKP
jgi:hypothetical protein